MAFVEKGLGGKWKFREFPIAARRMRDLDEGQWLDCEIPSSIYANLMAAGLTDPFDFRANPEKYDHISDKPWIYKTEFDIQPDMQACDRVELFFEGLDTFAQVWFNERLLGRTDNMFIPHSFDVTALLKNTDNRLLVKFEPARQHADKLMRRYGAMGSNFSFYPSRAYVRKAQYQFGWDWAPAMPGCGIFRPVFLRGFKKACIEDVCVRTISCSENTADVQIALRIGRTGNQMYSAAVSVKGHHTDIKQTVSFEPVMDRHSIIIRIENPKLWWPAGMGHPSLYNLNIDLIDGVDVIDTFNTRFGIREIKLKREDFRNGQSFGFEINGRDVNICGADWIGLSLMPGTQTVDDYRRMLAMARGANMNMLRVWGGGYYENSEFYDICDETGLMVWQDFMFACAFYPDRQWFMQKIEHEARTIVRRLGNHPCIAIWCGNNEIDWLYEMNSFGSGRKFYGRKIYHELLPSIMRELIPDSEYIPSTPLGPPGKANDPDYGTVHNWHIWSGWESTREYISPRNAVPGFVSEFGMQSVPCMQTLKSFVPDTDMKISSRGIEKHNYHIDGNSRLYRYITELFPPPADLDDLIYLSQLTQARGVSSYIRFLRSHPQKNCGVMFWQLHDCCPAVSWSAVDYLGRPKALWYYAKRSYEQTLISIFPEYAENYYCADLKLEKIAVSVLNQSGEALTGTLLCRLMDMTLNILDEYSTTVSITPQSVFKTAGLPRSFLVPPDASSNYILVQLKSGDVVAAEDCFFYLPDKYINWPQPQFTYSTTSIDSGRVNMLIEPKTAVKDLYIDSPYAADNFIDLISERVYEVELLSDFRGKPAFRSVNSTIRKIRRID